MTTRRHHEGHDEPALGAAIRRPTAHDADLSARTAAVAVRRPSTSAPRAVRAALPSVQRTAGNQAAVQLVRDAGLAVQRLDLNDHEGDGHTLERHVNVDDAYIKQRVDSGAVAKASRWKDKATADQVVTAALATPNAVRKINAVKRGQGATTHSGTSATTNGRYYNGTLTGSKDVDVIIRRKATAPFWYILTAFPAASDGVPVVEPAAEEPAPAVAPPAAAAPARGAWGARSGVDALLGRG